MNIAVFGDSIGKCVYQQDGGKYRIAKPNLEKYEKNNKTVTLENYSLFGSTVTKTLEVVERFKDSFKQNDEILIEIGGNDCDFKWNEIAASPDAEHTCVTPPDMFEKTYMQLIKLIRSRNCIPIILTMPPMIPERYINIVTKNNDRSAIEKWLGNSLQTMYRWQEMYNLMILKIAKKLNVKVIDIRSTFLEKHNCQDYISPDGIHPNEKGYQLIFDCVAKELSY